MNGIGLSPDGLGTAPWGNAVPQQPITQYQNTGGAPPVLPPNATTPVPYPIQGYTSNVIEPRDTSPQGIVHSSGVAALLVAAGIAGGAAVGGAFGAGAGLLLAGGLMNGYRAQKWMNSQNPSERHEAIVSSVFGVAQILGGGYLAYRAHKAR